MNSNDDEPVTGQVVPTRPTTDPDPSNPMADALGGAPGAGFDLGSMMQMAADMQQQVADAQEQLAAAHVEGSAGGGLVTVTLNGHLHLVGIGVQPDAVDPEDPSMLEDLIRAAWQDAHDQVARLQAQTDPLGGLGGLGDMFGGG